MEASFHFTKQTAQGLIKQITQHSDDYSLILYLLRINTPAALLFLHHYDVILHYDITLQTYLSAKQINPKFLFLFSYIKKFTPIYLNFYFKGRIAKNVPAEVMNEAINEIKADMFCPCQPLDQLINKYLQITLIKDKFKKTQKVYAFYEEIMKIKYQHNEIYQFCINYIKKHTQELATIFNTNMCCRVYFQKNERINSPESNVQQYKKYRYPIENENIIFHLKKTIVGFLNRRGGSLIIGIQQNQHKTLTVDGILLKHDEEKNQKKDFQKFIKQKIINQIFPKFNYQKADQQFAYHNNIKLCNSNQLHFNKYISMEYLPVINGQTLLIIPNTYIVRIRIKPGDYKQFYHLLNGKELDNPTPVFYIRQGKCVNKKNLIQGLPEFLTRINTKFPPQYPRYHQHCMFSLTPHDFSEQYAFIQNHDAKYYKNKKIKIQDDQSL